MEHEHQSLDSLLNDEPAAEIEQVEAAPEPTEVAEEAPSGPQRDENGRFTSRQEPGVEEPAPPADKLPQEDYKAIREEREKRQALQAELEALRNEFKASQQPKAEPAPPPPTIWEDDQAWQQHLQHQIMQQADQLSRINASEMAARSQHPDFQEKFDLFNEMAAQNPSIVQQAMADPHPWNKAYQIAANQQAIKELGATNLDELRAKVREELMAEQQAIPPVGQQLPPTLTTERNVGTRTGPAWSGPRSLDDMLG